MVVSKMEVSAGGTFSVHGAQFELLVTAARAGHLRYTARRL